MTDTNLSVRFVQEGGGVDLTVLLGDGSVRPSDGFGGWTQLDRKKRVGMSHWPGSSPIKMDIPLLLDGYSSGVSVKSDLDKISTLGRNIASDATEPPSFRVYGAILYSGTVFVMESLEFGDNLWEGGVLYRQALVAHVAEHVAGDVLAFQSAQAAGGKSGSATMLGGRAYLVQKGEDLYSIAVKMYKDKSRWKDIAQKNGIRDPKSVKPGRVLFLP